MMSVTTVLLLAVLFQGQVSLEVGNQVFDSIGSEAQGIHTPTLDKNYSKTQTVGIPYSVKVDQAGPYFIELRSFPFDGYLVLLDENGNLIAEDDDGLIGQHPRLTIYLQSNHQYSVYACALHGGRGEFRIELFAGAPASLTEAEEWLAIETDHKTRLEFLERTDGKMNLSYALQERKLGVLYFDRGDYEKAELRWKSVVETYRNVLARTIHEAPK